MKTTDLYASITDKIVRQLEAGTVPWIRPWAVSADNGMPRNAVTGRAYSGVNVLVLWLEAQTQGFASNRWMTYKQATAAGAQVRAGSIGTTVVFFKRLGITDRKTGEDKTIPMLRSFTVFNASQIDGLASEAPVAVRTQHERIEGVEAFIAATGSTLTTNDSRAYYQPMGDLISLPRLDTFEGPEAYYATSLHEHIHWSGAKHRLDRTFGSRFGDHHYAVEELVAELGAAFLCAQLGIPGELRHADYLASWLKVLKADSKAIFTASSAASKAAAYLTAFSAPVEEEDAPEALAA